MKINENNFFPEQDVALIKGGKDYFNLAIELIDNAKNFIYVVTYIFSEDNTGMLITKHLISAVKRKVTVVIIADGYATSLSSSFLKKLQLAGVFFETYSPLSAFNRHLGRRLHEKAIVIDGEYALIGGMNIDDKYNDMPQKSAWLDFAVLLKGNIVQQISNHCISLKNVKMLFQFQNKINHNCDFIPERSFFKCKVKLIKNDWLFHINEISSSYINMIMTAKKSIIILCSYFIPGKVLRRTLKNASARGVKIKVVTAGPSDVKIAKATERWLYDWMLRNKIEIYEYQKNILHGKLAIADSNRMTLGSYNLNDISTYVSMELNVDIIGSEFCKNAENIILNIINNDCKRVDNEIHRKNRPLLIQFYRWLSYILFRIIFLAFTASFKRKAH